MELHQPARHRRGRLDEVPRALPGAMFLKVTSKTPGYPAPMDHAPDKHERLAEDIRLLGRVLGDTIRALEGEPAFALVEEIRQLAVASRRTEDTASRRKLEATLDALSPEEAVS